MIDAHDTLISIHTKDGQNSQKIPFYQFLKKIVGAEIKLDDKIYLDVADLMTSGASSSGKSDDVSSIRKSDDLHKELEVTATSDAKTPKVKAEPTQNPESDSGKGNNLKIVSGTEAGKPRGRGRPRKEKTEQESNSEESSKALKGVLQKESSLSKAESAVNVLSSPQPPTSADDAQCPRRSRRTPARNSRFKDDFVDSSTLWSKGSSSSSSSWNTQLMTLALAAERHETKPTKQTGPSRKRNAVPSDDVADTEIEVASSAKDVCKQEPSEIQSDGESELQKVPADENEVEESTNNNHLELSVDNPEASTQILKRSLREALTHAQNGVRDVLSDKPLTINSHKNDNVCSQTYYVVMEPNLDASGDSFLVQKSGDGIAFNIANIEGKTPYENSTLSSNSYPQERLFSCCYCNSIFPSSEMWRQHNEQIHGECMQPQLQIPETLSREIHECPLCDEKFPMAFMLENHIRKNQHAAVPTHICNVCRHCFPSAAEKEEHMQLSHPADSCSLCGKEFDNIVVLRHHLKHGCPNSRPRNLTGDLATESNPSEREGKEDDEVENIQIDLQGVTSEYASESASVVVEKIPCNLCNSKFATYSGLWHHKLEAHRQFFPPGFQQKLQERLEKNETMLASTAAFERKNVSKESGRSRYFVVMQPKWLTSKPQLQVSFEDKKFSFSVLDNHVDEGPHSAANSREGAAARKKTRFVCQQCGDSFETASTYRAHRSQVHGECFEVVRYLGAFQCSQCSDTFPCQFMLDEHEKQHEGKKPLPCTLCGLSFHRIQERREHWKKSHPGIGCPNCGKMYASIKYLQKHISLDCRDHYPTTKKSNDSLKRHHNDVDVGTVEKKVEKKILKCHLCPKICSSIHCWRRHMSENHENDGFSKLSNTCIICNKVIYGYKALERHLLQEHAEESGLPIEEENAIVSEALKRSKVDLVDYRKAGRDQANIFQDEENLYHCPECPKTHPDLKAMMIHIKTHINMQLECSVCQKSFKNPTLLKQHVMRHRTKAVYTCDTCGKKFVTLQKLNKHNKVHHSKENFVCELCGMSFTLNDYLLKHKRCHTNKRPHSCSVCGKTFRTKPELRVHVLIHTQETPYVCEHCGRGFTQKGNWRIHLAQHTGHKPHKCNLCDLSFALPSHLKRHLFTHNQKVNYRCIWCDKECTQRKHMQMHVVRVHKEDFFHYEEQMKLETPIPIAPSQLKMYNRRLGKTGQVRKPYRTRAKKCSNATSQDIIKGVHVLPKVEHLDECIEDGTAAMETIIEPSLVETVATDLNLSGGPDIPQDGSLQILVSGDHQSYSKHGVTAGELIGDDPSNVEIVMGDNNEINIIINNADHHHHGMNGDLAVPVHEVLGEDGVVTTADVSTLPQFSEHASTAQLQMQGSLQQAVNALVNGSKGMGVGGEEGLALDIEALGAGGDTYAIVYPS